LLVNRQNNNITVGRDCIPVSPAVNWQLRCEHKYRPLLHFWYRL